MTDSALCSRCGHANREAARFCARCGTRLHSQAELLEGRGSGRAESEPALPSEGASATAPPEKIGETAAAVASDTAHAHEAAELAGFRSLGRRARWVQWVFIVLILASAVAIGADGAEIALMDRVIAGEGVTDAELEANDSRQMSVGLVVLALWVPAAVVFIRWFHAAYRNMRAFGLNLRFRPGWSIAAWFVPLLNLWRPKQIANDIWRGSDPALPAHLDPWSRPVPALVGFWWAAWIVGLLVSRGAFRSSFSASTAEEFRTAAIVDVVGLAIEITGAVLAILFVRRVTGRQDARVAQLRVARTLVPSPQAS